MDEKPDPKEVNAIKYFERNTKCDTEEYFE
jgi:hypothetical protein